MTENPYSAPTSNVAPEQDRGAIPGTGAFLLEKCLSDGWNNTLGHIGLILVSAFVWFLMTGLSYMTIIGIFVIVPVLLWGATRFAINIHDGRAEFSDLLSGFQEYGSKLGPALVLMILMLLLSLAGSAVYYLGAATGDMMISLIGSLVSLLYSVVVMSRFTFAYLFMVDQDLGAVDSIKASWNLTGPIWGRVILLAIVSGLVAMLGVLALGIGILISLPVSYLMYVSAYRQAAGRPAL